MSHRNPATPAMYAHQIFKAFPHKPHANNETTPQYTNLGELDKAFNSFVDEMGQELAKLVITTAQSTTANTEFLCYVRCSRFYFHNLAQNIQGADIVVTSIGELIDTLNHLFEVHKNALADSNTIVELNVGFQQKQNGDLVDIKGFKFVVYQLKS